MNTTMDYSGAQQWLIGESAFQRETLGKVESVFSLGNGYMGLRSATEEAYVGEQRGLFVAGCFNCCHDSEVTELPNGPDVTGTEFTLNGQRFALDTGVIHSYSRTLHLKTGELRRTVHWEAPDGAQYKLDFYRFVSRAHLPLVGQKIVIQPLSGELALTIRSGINGQITNSGAQHFIESQKRAYERSYLQYVCETTQSHILYVTTQAHTLWVDGERQEVTPVVAMGRRKIFGDYSLHVSQGSTVVLEKLSTIHVSRTPLLEGKKMEEIQSMALDTIRELQREGYDTLFAAGKKVWEQEWEQCDIVLESTQPIDQLAVRFAQYHLSVMTPTHDSRMSVGAKGLSGEGYKGHTFWDCDQFVLPYFTFTFPEKAKRLCTYRYLTLPGAREKARAGGFDGAQFPWESAWVTDGEVTPPLGSADLITGLPQIIWTGKIEQHITADVVYGVWQYIQATGDWDFLQEKGYELILDTAKFWCSRLEEGDDGQLHINDVIGPDEYKEHVNDNAYTNYMVWWNLNLAQQCLQHLKETQKEQYQKLHHKLGLDGLENRLSQCIQRLYLPKPNEYGLMAQDSTYLTLQDIDLTKYKEQDYVLGIYKDYNAEQINHIQVSKQADILILFYLLEHLFDQTTKKVNYEYYEARTLHDSSLSLSTHCILAADLNLDDQSYHFFQQAAAIDMGPNMKSSDEGIHSASIGGIWQCVVFGFAGVRLVDGELRIIPQLPAQISKISFPLCWRGERLRITVEGTQISIQRPTSEQVEIYQGEYRSKADSTFH